MIFGKLSHSHERVIVLACYADYSSCLLKWNAVIIGGLCAGKLQHIAAADNRVLSQFRVNAGFNLLRHVCGMTLIIQFLLGYDMSRQPFLRFYCG